MLVGQRVLAYQILEDGLGDSPLDLVVLVAIHVFDVLVLHDESADQHCLLLAEAEWNLQQHILDLPHRDVLQPKLPLLLEAWLGKIQQLSQPISVEIVPYQSVPQQLA